MHLLLVEHFNPEGVKLMFQEISNGNASIALPYVRVCSSVHTGCYVAGWRVASTRSTPYLLTTQSYCFAKCEDIISLQVLDTYS